MYNNTISKVPTRFLTGVDLIIEARKTFNIASENWTYPKMTFGDDNTEYYAELWSDGMDYNQVIWIIEGGFFNHEGKINPLIIIDGDDLEKFNKYDYDRLLIGLLWRRRNIILNNLKGYNFDDDFSYLYVYDTFLPNNNIMQKCSFEHGSQVKVEFYINYEFLKKI